MIDFRKLLQDVCERPSMYVGRSSLVDVSHFLAGYCMGLSEAGLATPFDGFMRWVEMKFLIRHPGWHWTRILLHNYGSDLASLRALPSLYEEFLDDLERLGSTGISSEATRRIEEKYGQDWWEPPETDTTPFDSR